MLGLTAGWLFLAAFGLSLVRAARHGDLPASRHVRERSLTPPPPPGADELGDYPSLGEAGQSRPRRFITDPLPEAPVVKSPKA